MRFLPPALFLTALLATHADAQVTTRLVASGVARPLWAGAPGGDPRIFLGLQGGKIRVVESGALLATPFLDLAGKVSTGDEQGLLGIAFHPDYANNGLFYVDYTDLSGNTVVSRFSVSSDPNVADAGSEQVVLTQLQPFANHNGGDLHFGPDGYLYIFFGDGGSANDPACRAQKLATRLGKVLRIDVDSGSPYSVPPDNPFVGVTGAISEIYLLGLRNPWRNSFDRLTGDLFIGDVGQDLREEIDFAPAGVGGLNFGWKVMEGTLCNFTTSGCVVGTPPCNDPIYRLPIIELLHEDGSFSITGGYVYRGCAIPSEQGKYFFADFGDHKIRSLVYDRDTGTVSNFQDRTAELAPGGGLAIRNIASFGEDGFGELLIVDHTIGGGEVYKMVPAGAVASSAGLRNGGGTNPLCFTSASRPIIDNVWELRVDTSVHPGAVFSVVAAYSAPLSGAFFPSGELLVDISNGTRLFRMTKASSGGVDVYRVRVPCRASLNGVQAFTQAAVLGGGAQLCNAIDATVGYY